MHTSAGGGPVSFAPGSLAGKGAGADMSFNQNGVILKHEASAYSSNNNQSFHQKSGKI